MRRVLERKQALVVKQDQRSDRTWSGGCWQIDTFVGGGWAWADEYSTAILKIDFCLNHTRPFTSYIFS